jgi:Family of unknown function (DUF6527)
MTKGSALKHEFVEFIPENLDEGTVYVSIRFATASHKCCCGCGNKVVTPIRPTDWKLIFDGKTVSLDPSIGNWSFPCRSHYWIRNNHVRWAGQWSAAEIDAGRAHDQIAKQQYFEPTKTNPTSLTLWAAASPEKTGGLWQRVKQWWQS